MKLDNPIFHDADKAREHLEAQRWPHGPICPHCANSDQTRVTPMKGKAHRPGLYNCMECRQQFTVTVGTVFERSKIALNKWLLATFLMTSSKKGMSAHQLHRMLGVTYKTAWFMAHRIREAMKEDVASSGPMGGEGKTIEADETYIGKRETPRKLARGRIANPTKSGKAGGAQKRIVVGLVERGGKARMFHLNDATKETVRTCWFAMPTAPQPSTPTRRASTRALARNMPRTRPPTTRTANTSATKAEVVHSNTIESLFSVFKRGMVGVYQHCGEAHLHRYLAEFDFRYNRRTALKVTDTERHDDLLSMIGGKRLTYRRVGEARYA